MTFVVYILGVVLVVAGAASIAMGIPIVRMEMGWSEVIGGSVAGSAGFIIIVLGLLLARLDALLRATRDQRFTAPARGPAEEAPDVEVAPFPLAAAPFAPPAFAPSRTVSWRDPEVEVQPEPAMAEATLHDAPDEIVEPPQDQIAHAAHDLDEGAPALAAVDETDLEPSPPVPSMEPVQPALAPEPVRARSTFLSSFLAKRSAAAQAALVSAREEPVMEPVLEPLPRTELKAPSFDLTSLAVAEDQVPPPLQHEEAQDASGSHRRDHVTPALFDHHTESAALLRSTDDEHVLVDEPEPATMAEERQSEAPEPPPSLLAPVVVGRYNAGSASYVMYSNGMIEVETESGTHQFASMQDLKSFIEKRDAAQV